MKAIFTKPTVKRLPGALYRRLRKSATMLAAEAMGLAYALPPISLGRLAPNAGPVEEPILEDICLPPYFGGSDHDDYVPLMKIVTSLQPEIVVEFGTAYGNTVANICRHAPGARVYTINAPAEEQNGVLVTFHLSRDEIGRVYRKHGFEGRVAQIFKNTLELELKEYLAAPVVDLAIIDACHDTRYVLNDFSKIAPFVRPDGTVLLHDTHPSMRGHLLDSYRACMVLRRRGFDLRHLENTWWAVWVNRAANGPFGGSKTLDSSGFTATWSGR